MEIALRYELINKIPELANSIYPTNAPEGILKPYLVYARINTKREKTFDGYGNKQALSYMFSIMATKYGEMKSLTNKVEDFLISLVESHIGAQQIYVEDIDINNITEQYEHELGINRGIIDFTIYI